MDFKSFTLMKWIQSYDGTLRGHKITAQLTVIKELLRRFRISSSTWSVLIPSLSSLMEPVTPSMLTCGWKRTFNYIPSNPLKSFTFFLFLFFFFFFFFKWEWRIVGKRLVTYVGTIEYNNSDNNKYLIIHSSCGVFQGWWDNNSNRP